MRSHLKKRQRRTISSGLKARIFRGYNTIFSRGSCNIIILKSNLIEGESLILTCDLLVTLCLLLWKRCPYSLKRGKVFVKKNISVLF